MSEPKYIDKLAPLIAMATMECCNDEDCQVRDKALSELRIMARLADDYSWVRQGAIALLKHNDIKERSGT